jgi:hypothetical protein
MALRRRWAHVTGCVVAAGTLPVGCGDNGDSFGR